MADNHHKHQHNGTKNLLSIKGASCDDEGYEDAPAKFYKYIGCPKKVREPDCADELLAGGAKVINEILAVLKSIGGRGEALYNDYKQGRAVDQYRIIKELQDPKTYEAIGRGVYKTVIDSVKGAEKFITNGDCSVLPGVVMTATKVGKVLANLNKETAVAEVAVSLVSTYGNTPTDVISNSKESFLGQLSSKDARKLFLSMDWLIRTGKFDGKYLDVEQIDQVRQCIVNHILEHEHEHEHEHEYEINSQTVNECVSQGR